jgi:dTDP-4-amino-4,6-dideoxygalactose transaminase
MLTAKEQEKQEEEVEKTRWVWPRTFSSDLMMKYLQPSIDSGHLTNHGPCAQKLEKVAASRLKMTRHCAVATASGAAALHALVSTYQMMGYDFSKGILISAFGFPPILQQNWSTAIVTDIDPRYGGPVLPTDGSVPAAVCVVNPFGYAVDCAYYRAYCDEHKIPFWMDNAACPLHVTADGSNLTDLADAAIISLHETKAIGRGEGGLLLVKPEFVDTAFRAVTFGYDPTVYCLKIAHLGHLRLLSRTPK